jgi:uncharacterized protein (TIGR00251 family)
VNSLGPRIISVAVKPYSKKAQVVEIEPGSYEISITAKPVKGKANKEIIELLANFFGVSKSRIQILRGVKSRKKIIQIEEE